MFYRLLALLFLLNLGYADNTDIVKEMTLPNGLKVIVKPDHRSPVVISMIWYRVGSSAEQGGHSGLAHALEHMMFKGTDNYPEGMLSTIIAAKGGEQNAMTGADFTAYFQKLGQQHLATSFELEADRMQNLNVDEKAFNKEMNVIKEERRMRYEDNPQALTYERLRAAAFLAHPYHHPAIGWMNDLDNMTLADAMHWYKTWYRPNNAVVVVVGDVTPESVFTLAKQYFAAIPAEALPERKPQREPPALGEKRVAVNAKAHVPLIFMAYNTPSLVTAHDPKDAYALAVLASILDGGESSRLTRQLIREQHIASEASASYSPYYRFDNLFVLSATPTAKTDLPTLEQALRDQIHQLQTTLVDPQELARVKTQVIADNIYQQDSITGQAMLIGMAESIGLFWRDVEQYSEHIQQVTAEQLQAVAKQYLTPERLTIATLLPEEIS